MWSILAWFGFVGTLIACSVTAALYRDLRAFICAIGLLEVCGFAGRLLRDSQSAPVELSHFLASVSAGGMGTALVACGVRSYFLNKNSGLQTPDTMSDAEKAEVWLTQARAWSPKLLKVFLITYSVLCVIWIGMWVLDPEPGIWSALAGTFTGEAVVVFGYIMTTRRLRRAAL